MPASFWRTGVRRSWLHCPAAKRGSRLPVTFSAILRTTRRPGARHTLISPADTAGGAPLTKSRARSTTRVQDCNTRGPTPPMAFTPTSRHQTTRRKTVPTTLLWESETGDQDHVVRTSSSSPSAVLPGLGPAQDTSTNATAGKRRRTLTANSQKAGGPPLRKISALKEGTSGRRCSYMLFAGHPAELKKVLYL